MSEREKARPRHRILLADHNDAIQTVVKRVAEDHGHELVQAFSGATALETAAVCRPDIIVLDLEFPNEDGRDVLSKLKSDQRTMRIPVIVWSGRKDHDSDSRISLDLGAEDYVEKHEAILLIRKVERVLLRHLGSE
jgi:DNA-binding response OmpR family regulator